MPHITHFLMNTKLFSASTFFIFLICSSSILCLIIYYELNLLTKQETINTQTQNVLQIHDNKNACRQQSPKYAVYGHNLENGYLKHVYEMFESFGFKRTYELDIDNWEVLWAHDYPFTIMKESLKHMRENQKVNHFPGTGFITNKLDLVKTDSIYIPKAFEMPAQKERFLKYVSKNRNKIFVQKSNNHRGISIKAIDELELNKNGTFIQEFVDKPLLVDGHKFDVGVYTIITSFEPLRIYIYNGDVLFRFCPDVYHPFDAANHNKYVIGDNYLPIWELPSLNEYFNENGYSMKTSFDFYMKQKNIDTKIIWAKVEDAIRTLILTKEKSIAKILKQNYQSRKNFFELMRFDFVVDENLNVFIMEANMSPNLSSAHYPANKLIYYQVLYNLFSLVGLREYLLETNNGENVDIKNLMVYPEICTSTKCALSCNDSECLVCLKCLNKESIKNLKQSYLEHKRRHDCKRIFPPTFQDVQKYNLTTYDYSSHNLLLYTWFNGKCELDEDWC